MGVSHRTGGRTGHFGLGLARDNSRMVAGRKGPQDLANSSDFHFDVISLSFSRRHVLYGKAARMSDAPPSRSDYRSDLKPARTSSEKSCGCSQAAKCLPFSSLL